MSQNLSKKRLFLFDFLEFCNFVRIMRFLMDYAESCDLRSIMRNRNIAEYQKPCRVYCRFSWTFNSVFQGAVVIDGMHCRLAIHVYLSTLIVNIRCFIADGLLDYWCGSQSMLYWLPLVSVSSKKEIEFFIRHLAAL